MQSKFAGSSAMAFVTSRTRGATGTTSRALKNSFKLYGFILSLKLKGPAGSGAGAAAGGAVGGQGGSGSDAKKKVVPKWTVTVRLGSLANDPAADKLDDGTYVRTFPIQEATNMKIAPRALVPEAKNMVVPEYSDFQFTVEARIIDEMGPFQKLDVVELQSISFSYWLSEGAKRINDVDKTDRVLRFCNVDMMRPVVGAHRAALAYNLWMNARMPVRRLGVNDGDGEDGGEEDGGAEDKGTDGRFKRLLGKHFYPFPVFGSDAVAESAALEQPSGQLYYPDTTEAVDPNNAQVQIVTVTPAVFNGEVAVPHLGFKSNAKGIQWTAPLKKGEFGASVEAGDAIIPQIYFTMIEEHTGILGISGTSDWKALAPSLLGKCKFLMVGRENLERTKGELYNQDGMDERHEEEGVTLKFISSIAGMAMNTMEEVERIGIKVPFSLVASALGAKPQAGNKEGDLMLESPQHDAAFHKIANRDSVLSLNEWHGNLSQLEREGRYNYYLITDLALKDEEDQEYFDATPRDKQYLLYDPAFAAAMRGKDDDAAARRPVNVQFGLAENNCLAKMIRTAKNMVSVKRVYAVLKPERRLQDVVKADKFIEAVRHILPAPDAFLADLSARLTGAPAPAAVPAPGGDAAPAPGGFKRTLPEEEKKSAEAHPAKRQRTASQDEAPSAEEGASAPTTGKKAEKKVEKKKK